MRIHYLFILVLIAFLINGCTLYRLVYVKTNTKITHLKRVKAKHKRKHKKRKKPITHKYQKRKIIKSIKNRECKTLEPEPFSINSKKQDPELLGPQTTLKDNPILKKSATSNKM